MLFKIIFVTYVSDYVGMSFCYIYILSLLIFTIEIVCMLLNSTKQNLYVTCIKGIFRICCKCKLNEKCNPWGLMLVSGPNIWRQERRIDEKPWSTYTWHNTCENNCSPYTKYRLPNFATYDTTLSKCGFTSLAYAITQLSIEKKEHKE